MPKLSGLEDINHLYAARGGMNYGEGVTQREHALQCAVLAEAEGAAPSLVVAALLHDIGHLLENEADVAQFKVAHRHEIAGARALAGLFDTAVRAPIALHVAAKRYLCFKDAHYLQALSPASQKSLQLQGGPFDAAGAAGFERRPHWREALALRRFDDRGKQTELVGRSFADFAPLMRALALGES